LVKPFSALLGHRTTVQGGGNPGLAPGLRAWRPGSRSLVSPDGTFLRQTSFGLEEIEPTRALRTPRRGREGRALLDVHRTLSAIEDAPT